MDSASAAATIRAARAEEARALAALARETYTEAFGPATPPGELQAHLDGALTDAHVARWLRADVMLVAEADGRLVGFVQAGDSSPDAAPEGASVELRRLYVRAAFQNQGLGGRLLRAALAHPRLRAAAVWLDVWERNAGAQRLYARHGFARVGERRFFFPSGAEGDLDFILVRPLEQ